MKEGFDNTITKLAFPFLQRLGELWVSNALHPALEHFASNIIKKKIHIAIDGITKKSSNSKLFLLFLPPGEMHEMGLLYASYIIKSHGHDVLYFGQNTPLENFFEMLENVNADYILSVFTSCNSAIDPIKFVNQALEHWPNIKIIMAGFRLKNEATQMLLATEYANNVKVMQKPTELKQYIESIPQNDFITSL